MAGDPLTDTYVDQRNTWDTSSPSQSHMTYTGTYTSVVVVHSRDNIDELIEKLEEFLRKESIQKMKNQWSDFKKQFKPASKLRPSIQLRCVCLDGRGWA